MSLCIAGMGWVTPLGSGVNPVWRRLLQGDESAPESIEESPGHRSYSIFRVPDSALASLKPHPRLRRASAISRFATAAGLEALEDAGINLDPENAKKIALVFAVSNGGVIYTKRFYRDIVESGPQSASPLFFPETVFNAPASHLAAILGITGTTYTLVGDGAVGLLAVRMAEDLMANQELDHCLVVGAEEADWVLCDAYRKWRLLRVHPPIEPFSKTTRGTILSEGAGAIVLGREGPIRIERTHAGGYYRKRNETELVITQILSELAKNKIDIVISSANGTFIDKAESGAISAVIPRAQVYTEKPALGESVGAGGLWQIIAGAKSLIAAELPPLLHLTAEIPLHVSATRAVIPGSQRAVVISCGLNQQVAGICLAATP
ncbi:MAG: beta-ketoacyl synthase N-terminal-like domain-containing protein [Verrucomicrobiota bacterium]